MPSLADVKSTGEKFPPRIVLVGGAKVGKSTFASKSKSPIAIPIVGEEGLDEIDCPRTPVCNSYDDVQNWVRILAKEEHEYKTCFIDSVSALEPVLWKRTLDRWNEQNVRKQVKSIEALGGGYGKGFAEALNEWQTLLRGLDFLRQKRGMTIILIGHSVVRRHDDPQYGSWDVWDAALNKQAAALLYRWSDCVLFANVKVLTTEDSEGDKQRSLAGGQYERCLYTQVSTSHPAGGRGRYGHLPAELPLSWQAFSEAVKNVK